jgi:putative endonuclease
MPKPETSYSKGIFAESMAALYLKAKGYKILEMRYKTKYGEIDIIAIKSGVLVFAEVKARADKAQALESVTPRTQKRIANSALYFLSENEIYNDYDMRFDFIGIVNGFSIHHLDNAWEAQA